MAQIEIYRTCGGVQNLGKIDDVILEQTQLTPKMFYDLAAVNSEYFLGHGKWPI